MNLIPIDRDKRCNIRFTSQAEAKGYKDILNNALPFIMVLLWWSLW